MELMDVGMSISSDACSNGGEISMKEFGEKFIENIYTMSLRIPSFSLLCHDDQLRLLENGWVELFLIALIETTSLVIMINSNSNKSDRNVEITNISGGSDDQEEETMDLPESHQPAEEEEENDETSGNDKVKSNYLKKLQVEVDRMRALGFKPRELDYLRGLILFNPSKCNRICFFLNQNFKGFIFKIEISNKILP